MTPVSRGEVDYTIKSRYGQQISVDAAINYNLNKIQCELCKYSFCNKCQIEPYHLGYTCEEYQIYLDTRKCRFCNDVIGKNKQQVFPKVLAFEEVCNSGSCKELMDIYCSKFHKDCGHICYGAKHEPTCLPCLNLDCVNKNQDFTYGVNAQDFCSICQTAELGQHPSVQLDCKHIFHKNCIKKVLDQKYSTLRITFGNLNCPICGILMDTSQSHEVESFINQKKQFKERVYKEAHTTALREGLYNEEEYKERKEFHANPREYAMLKLAFYECYKCQKIYCGGRRDCEAELNEANQTKREDLLCVYCTALKLGNQFQPCNNHGEEFIEYKCQFCCDIASWFCWGATRFCDPCHNIATFNIPKICNPNSCKFNGNHPPNGQPHSFGCKLCKISEEEKQQDEAPNIIEKQKELISKLLKKRLAIQELKKRKNEFMIEKLSDEQEILLGAKEKQNELS
eukprot:403357427